MCRTELPTITRGFKQVADVVEHLKVIHEVEVEQIDLAVATLHLHIPELKIARYKPRHDLAQ
jgi:hypothetical protein